MITPNLQVSPWPPTASMPLPECKPTSLKCSRFRRPHLRDDPSQPRKEDIVRRMFERWKREDTISPQVQSTAVWLSHDLQHQGCWLNSCQISWFRRRRPTLQIVDKLRPRAICATILLSELSSSIMVWKCSACSASSRLGVFVLTIVVRRLWLSISPSPVRSRSFRPTFGLLVVRAGGGRHRQIARYLRIFIPGNPSSVTNFFTGSQQLINDAAARQ